MDQSLLVRPELYAEREDPYSTVKQDFGKIFYENNLGNYANASDLGFLDYGKNYYDQYNGNMDDQHHHQSEPEHHHPQRGHAHREDVGHYTDGYHNSTYSPISRPHQATGPYGNAGYPYGAGKQQAYQQEPMGYSNYPQSYYHPNHYDHHMVQNGYDNGADYYHGHQNPQDMLVDTYTDDPLSHMWSNESAKNLKNRNVAATSYMEPAMKPKLATGYGSYEQEGMESYGGLYGQDAKRNQFKAPEPSRMAHRKSFDGMNMFGMEPTSLNVTNPNKYLGAGVKNGSRPLPSQQFERADNLYEDDEDDGEDGFGEGKGRSSRGLRVLSLKVKEIVIQKKRTTYKEVAETLTWELRSKAVGAKASKDETKDEQNVKRRVYDALNVLIATGVLRKEGKMVYCDGNADVSLNRMGGSGNKQKLEGDLLDTKKRIKQKAELLQELIFKCLAIKNLIKTNKAKLEREAIEGVSAQKAKSTVSATRIEVVQDNASLKPKNEDVIRFPFIVLLSSSNDNSMNLNMDQNQKQLAIESTKPFNIFGDIDVLLKMGLHFVPKEMFEKSIPYELQRFVPKYYLAALK